MDGWMDALSAAQDFEQISSVTLAHARRIAAADGATFVLREGDRCFYVDEDSMAPLWKGQRFPIRACISGWAMRRGEVVEVADIELDERIPLDAYRPTFVRSLTMVPMGTIAPVGAIGVYWSRTGQRVTARTRAELERLAHAVGLRVAELGIANAPWAPTFTRAS